MRTRFVPLGKRIVIERLALPERSETGLWILGREFPSLGRVLAVSSWVPYAFDLLVDDLVYFNRAAVELRAIPREPDHFVLDIGDLYARIRE